MDCLNFELQSENKHLLNNFLSEFNDRFPEEYETNNSFEFYESLSFLESKMTKKEKKQCIKLWEINKKYETILTSLSSGEFVIRGYTLSLKNEGIEIERRNELLYQQLNEKIPNLKDRNIKPTIFRIIHFDGSGECYSHGEVGIFVDESDPYANILINMENSDENNDLKEQNDETIETKLSNNEEKVDGKHERSWSIQDNDREKKKEKKSEEIDEKEGEGEEKEESDDEGVEEDSNLVPLYLINIAFASFDSSYQLIWDSIPNITDDILIQSILKALHLEESRDPLRTISIH